jgi:hypothetical protein
MSDKATPTFIAEDIPISTATIVSGTSLRLSYVFRAESKYIGEIFLARIANPGDSTVYIENYNEKTWESLRDVWRKEAEIKYPDEGDYVMQVYDPITELPIPLGEDVIFIGGDIREVPGGQPCIEYLWDLTGIPPGPDPYNPTVAIIVYRDCYNVEQTISDTIDNIGLTTYLCMGQLPSVLNMGVLTEVGPCDLTYKQCTQYFWDLTGVPLLDIVTINYIDCDQLPVSWTGMARDAITIICGERDSFTVTAGFIVLQQTCI